MLPLGAGKTFVLWLGIESMVYVVEPEVLKQLSTLKYGTDKPSFLAQDRKPLLGKGLFSASGTKWQQQRRIVSPSFNMDRVKGMVDVMKQCAMELLISWERAIADAGGAADIEVCHHLDTTSADILSQTTFGSNYETGKLVFEKLTELQFLLFQPGRLVGVPGGRYLPTDANRKIWALQKEVDGLLRSVIRSRREAGESGSQSAFRDDLLGVILAESKTASSGDPYFRVSDQELADQLKIFYFAGHETVFLTISWALLLLATNPDWQEKARAEVQELMRERSHLIDADLLSKMKIVQMVLNETLRLYPPVSYTRRYASRAIPVGSATIPAGTNFCIPIIALHHDPDLWGEDVHEFNPDRFSHGGAAAACKQAYSYLPFGLGVRLCVGQNLAMVEMRMLLALILWRFRVAPSPKYRHAPVALPLVRPKHGLHLILQKSRGDWGDVSPRSKG
eukprot:c20304_g1_i1 orf=161-1510(-)